MVDHEEDFLSGSLDDISMKVFMGVSYFCFALVLNLGLGKPLKEAA